MLNSATRRPLTRIDFCGRRRSSIAPLTLGVGINMGVQNRDRQSASFRRPSYKSLQKNPVYIRKLYSAIKSQTVGLQYRFLRAPKVRFSYELPQHLRELEVTFRASSPPQTQINTTCLQFTEVCQYYGKLQIALNFIATIYRQARANLTVEISSAQRPTSERARIPVYDPESTITCCAERPQQSAREEVCELEKLLVRVVRQICRHGAYYQIHKEQFYHFCRAVMDLARGDENSTLPVDILMTLLQFCGVDHTLAKLRCTSIYRTIIMYTFTRLFFHLQMNNCNMLARNATRLLSYCYRHKLIRLYMFVNLFVNSDEVCGVLTLKKMSRFPLDTTPFDKLFNRYLHTVWLHLLEDRHYDRRCQVRGCLTWPTMCSMLEQTQPSTLTEACAVTILREQNLHTTLFESSLLKFWALDDKIGHRQHSEKQLSIMLAKRLLSLFDHEVSLAMVKNKKRKVLTVRPRRCPDCC